ncbi:MAG: phosphate acyltransferase, partial [Aestuariivirga sp.]
MNTELIIAIDAMGGDHGPVTTIAGVDLAAQRHPDACFMLFGDAGAIAGPLAKAKYLQGKVEVHNAEITVTMDEKPSQALRRGRNKSGMWLAIDAVRKAEAKAVVSAGNTGALMAMS